MAAAVVRESRYDPRADTVEALDARLVALARSGAPVRRALARIAGELVRRRAWDPLGFVRPADYGRERPGLSARELYELAHVDGALAKLPAIDAAFSSGRLGWTKARLLCRVARPEDEARWLEAAGRLSATALAREVRAIDLGSLEAGAAEADDEPDERDVLRIRTAKGTPSRWGAFKALLRRLTGEWLPNETCVELIAAEVLSAIRLDEDPDEPPPLARRVGVDPDQVPPLDRRYRDRERRLLLDGRQTHAEDVPPAGAGCGSDSSPEPSAPPAELAGGEAPPPSPFLDAFTAGLDAATPRELDRRICRAAALEQGLLARIGRLLFALSQARGHFDLGFRSLDAYARERLGVSPRMARALLRVGRAGLLAPAFGHAWHDGQLTCSQAQALVPLVLAPGSEPFHAGWIERAAGVTVRRLEDDVDHALASGVFDPASLRELPDLDIDLDDVPEGAQIGARHRGGEETVVWVAHVPADVGARRTTSAACTRACFASPGARPKASSSSFPSGASARATRRSARSRILSTPGTGGSQFRRPERKCPREQPRRGDPARAEGSAGARAPRRRRRARALSPASGDRPRAPPLRAGARPARAARRQPRIRRHGSAAVVGAGVPRARLRPALRRPSRLVPHPAAARVHGAKRRRTGGRRRCDRARLARRPSARALPRRQS
jgi:hypothetical protein